MSVSMERRNAQVFDVEATIPDESADSSPTVVVSAAPLQPCVRTSAPTVRLVAVSRLPGTALGTVPPAARRARMWVIEEPLETAPVGPVPMPGEPAHPAAPAVSPRDVLWACEPSSSAVTAVAPRAARPFDPSTAAATRVLPLGMRASAVAIGAPTRVAPRVAMRAGEPPVQYSVERAVSGLTTQRAPAPRKRRAGHVLVLIIGILAGFMTVLSAVVILQQRDMQSMAAPAQRADEACAAYADEVHAIARELTQAAGDVEDVEKRIGERARSVASNRAMQRLCAAPLEVTCSTADAACIASAVMQLRQALARR